jgi:hypothetical protein
MSAATALKAARDAGIELGIDGDDLLLEAVSEPPAATLEALSRHKAEIIELLRPGRDGWSAEDWRLFFEERAAIAEFDGGLPRAKAEAQAFECCLIEWLNRNPSPSAPGRCGWCGRSESQDAVVLPYGTEREPTSGLAARPLLDRVANNASISSAGCSEQNRDMRSARWLHHTWWLQSSVKRAPANSDRRLLPDSPRGSRLTVPLKEASK